MEITTALSFISYYQKIRERTNKLIALVPANQLEFTYREGKYTIGDIVRHVACIERYMYAETVAGRKTSYKGCHPSLAGGYENTFQMFYELHAESLEIFSSLSNEDLQKKCITPSGHSVTTWKWLRALVEHEVHHRGQIYIYLGMLGIVTPPIFGLTAEDVEAAGGK